MSNEQFWAEARKADISRVRDKWWERLAHIRNGKIGDGVHVVYEWMGSELIRAYIGHEAIGPCLQYDVSGDFYTGNMRLSRRPIWYNCYSRGNYGRKYAHGGNWSGHCRGLHPRIMSQHLRTMDRPPMDWMPDGSVTMIDLDCSPSWSICYPTAAAAFVDRLTSQELQEADLPIVTKQHMADRLTDDVIGQIKDIIEAYAL